MNTPNQNNRGSEWRKWDLHIHSPQTFLNNEYGRCSDGDFINGDFIKKIKSSGLSAIGLTDYFKFENTFWDLKKKLENEGIVVFPNLEFRSEHTNKQNDCCDFHIIFSNLSEKKHVDDFLTNLDANVMEYEKPKTIKVKNMEKKEHFRTATVSFKKSIDILNERTNKELDFIVAFLSKGKGNSRSSVMYEHMADYIDVILHSSCSEENEENIDTDRKFWLDQNKPKPLLQSSDAHKLDDIGTKFTWIKADTTFEGLKQIIYEPKERVSVQKLEPDNNKKQSMIIDCIEYSNKKGNMEKVLFNQNLNSLIGIRGSGKSNLLKNIVKHSDSGELENRKLSDKEELLPLDNFKITWCGDFSDTDDRKILFIPQKYLGNKVYEEGKNNSESIHEFITGLLRGNTIFRNAQENIEKIKLQQSKNISGMVADLLSIQEKIKELEKDIKKYPKKEYLEKEIKEKKNNLKKERESINISNSELKDYQKDIKKKTEIKNKVKQHEKDSELYNILSESDVLDMENIFSRYEFSENEKEKINSHTKKGIDDSKKFIENRKIEIDAKISEYKEKIKKIDIKINPIKKKLEKREDIKKLDEDIEKDNNGLIKLNLLIERKREKELEEEEIKDNIKDVYGKTIENIKNISKSINFPDIKNVKIKSELVFNNNSFSSNFLEKLFENDVEEYREINIEDAVEKIGEIFDKLISGSEDQKKKIRVKKAHTTKNYMVDLFDFQYYILDYLKNIQNEDGEYLENMSAGQKMITLLTLIFSFDDNEYPVLIDQPEDDLDSTTISTIVCNFIRNQKKNRQIIIATHNANLVIGSDSEEVLIANNKKGIFNYQTGSIENPKVNEKIVEILEGGEEAIKKRRERYQF